MADSRIRYVIADDHTLFREGLRLVLQDDPMLELVAEASDGFELLDLLALHPADVVLLDIFMPGMDGIAATKEIRQRFPQVRILILTMNDDEQLILHLMQIGANGYLVKNADSQEIKLALHTCVLKGHYFSSRTGELLLQSLSKNEQDATRARPLQSFTSREKEVLELICEGLTAAQIGKKIFLSPRTVEGIRATLMEKTGACNVAGLVMYAARNRMISLG